MYVCMYVGEDVEKLEPLCTVECKMAQPLWKRVFWFLKKLKILPYEPGISILGICPKELKSGY